MKFLSVMFLMLAMMSVAQAEKEVAVGMDDNSPKQELTDKEDVKKAAPAKKEKTSKNKKSKCKSFSGSTGSRIKKRC